MKKKELNNIDFTFYGDLLGVSEFYKISENEGYKKLDDFYNLIYIIFKDKISLDMQIFIFSDSLFITGHRLKDTLDLLGTLYIELLKKQLFIKGAIVEGKLTFDPRLELDNLRKMLPEGDVLYRAVTLEKHAEGIRLIIEKKLAQKILPEELHGNYNESIYFKKDFNVTDEILWKIRWSSDLNAYDFLWLDYGIYEENRANQPKYWYRRIQEGKKHANKKAQSHYTETMRFIKRFYNI